MKRALLMAVVLLMFGACDREPFQPELWMPMHPVPSIYEMYWGMAEECARPNQSPFVDAPTFEEIEWRLVLYQDEGFECGFDFLCAGLHVKDHHGQHIIYIGQPWMYVRKIIIHEMLHALTPGESHRDGPSYLACNAATPEGP
jgi:hypothetical protein